MNREAFEAAAKECGDEEKFAKNMQLSLACYAYFIHGVNAALASQAQQSQWISVEERLPDGDVFVDVYIRSRSNTNFMQRETSVAFVSGKFKINRIFDCEYVSHWMPLPPAPEGGDK